jgi:hypothetical protein
VLRACVVNFRTTRDDIAALPEIVTRHGRELLGPSGTFANRAFPPPEA